VTQPVSRRSTLKAGAHAAWMVPTVSVVTAAPAHAAVSGQPELVLSGVMSSHGSDGPDLERPDLILSEFTLTNTGTGPAPSVVVGFFLPAGVTAIAPTLVLPSPEFAALPVEGNAGDGWWLRAMRALPLGAGESTSLGTAPQPLQVQLHDPVADSPYRRWAGTDFGATLQASADGAALITEFPVVEPSAATYFEGWDFYGSRTDDVLSLSARVTNVGRKTCTGPITLQISWTGGQPDGSRWTTMPGSASSPQLSGGTLGGDGSFGSPWTYTFSFDGPRATRQSFDDFYDAAADAHCDIAFDVEINLGTPPGYTPQTDSRDVTLYYSAWDVRDYPFILGFDTISGSDT
jgi:hypothetical protein